MSGLPKSRHSGRRFAMVQRDRRTDSQSVEDFVAVFSLTLLAATGFRCAQSDGQYTLAVISRLDAY
jgi:hypothetical protein